MLAAVMLFALGLVCLIKGGDWFVDGAAGIARAFRIPELLIGATVVSIGTTLPEVMVSTTSALSGHGEIAYGNAIGSIICNTALIAAISITLRPGDADRKALKLPVLFFFAAAMIYCITAYGSGNFGHAVGCILLMMFLIYLICSAKEMKNNFKVPNEERGEQSHVGDKIIKYLFFLILGAALIAAGANLLVENGIIIAQALGVPESVIALTFVALGTSLPELVTAVSSLIKGHGALSLGNIVGANLFNLVLVSGVSMTLAPFHTPQSAMFLGMNASLALEIPFMLLVMGILVLPVLAKGKLRRTQGILLLCLYAGFCIVQFNL